MQRTLFDADEPIRIRRPTDDEISRTRKRHPGMLLLFRVGESYQLFDEDATLASHLLGLEQRSPSRPVVSFLADNLQAHLRRLLHAGHRVAICDRGEGE